MLRDAILDALYELLLTTPWPAIKLSDVAAAAGISRQTLYKEFGSRQGLAQGYALRLADRLVDAVRDAIDDNVGQIDAAILQGFRDFFAQSANDPMVVSLITGEAKPDLLRIVTTDSGEIINRASERLATVFSADTWIKASDDDAGILARAIVRLALSYISMPPSDNNDVAADMARLLAPAVAEYAVMESD